MKKGDFVRATVGLFVVALSSFAFDTKQDFSAIQRSTQDRECSARYLQNALRAKTPNVETVIANFEIMTSNLSNLDLIANSFEALNPNLDESTRATLTVIRQKIQALSLAYDTSDRLVSQELQNYRFLIRTYAGHVAQQTRIVQSSTASIQSRSAF